MRRYFFALALAMTLNHVACGADNNATGGTSPAETSLKQANSMKIRLRIENRVLTATLIDSKTVRDFVSLLPADPQAHGELCEKLAALSLPLPKGQPPSPMICCGISPSRR